MGKEAFIVATEANHLTALDATTGAVLWDKGPEVFGPQVTAISKNGNPPGLPCGDIAPLGITGTPFINNGVIYFDAMTTPDSNMTFKHRVFAINVSDGSLRRRTGRST